MQVSFTGLKRVLLGYIVTRWGVAGLTGTTAGPEGGALIVRPDTEGTS